MHAPESRRTGGLGRRAFAAALGIAPLGAWALAAPQPLAAASAPAAAQAPAEPPPFTVRDARTLAAGAVKLVKDVEKVDLDYSPASLQEIDRIVLNMRDEGTQAATALQVLLVLGCYVGEVLVRNTDAVWEEPTPAERQAGARLPGVRGKSGRLWDPVERVFQLLRNGGGDSVAFYYAIVKRDVSGK